MEISKAWFVQAMPEVVLALETGVRRGELCGWLKSDFATRRHLYQVGRAVRRGQAGPELGEPKAHSRRTNPLSPHGQQAYDLLCARYPDSPYLLPGPGDALHAPSAATPGPALRRVASAAACQRLFTIKHPTRR